MTTFTHVDTPLTVGGVTIKNRVFRSGHATGLGAAGIGEDFIAYHAARARGGVGLSILEILGVHESSPSFLPAYNTAGMADGYRRLVDACAPHGMALFHQIWHGGHNCVFYDGRTTWAPSDVPSAYWHGVPPIPMTKDMIEEVVAGFADAARSLEAWGLQGVEIHAAHNYLVQQFLEPALNRREDEYGGPLENRARFLMEVLGAVRAAVSPGFAVGLRLGVSRDGGPDDEDELAQVVQMVQQGQLIDFVDFSYAGYYDMAANIGGMDRPVGYQLEHSGSMRNVTSVARFAIGRFRTLEEADAAIRAGQCDMVGMTRATIADPDLVRKSLAGAVDQVRPCIACNQDCVGGLMTAHRIGCVVNPAAGREMQFADHTLAPAETRRRVIVVGGGPAGMEAARVAALRGHDVVLFEAEPKLGGTVKLAARAPARAGIADIIFWLESEVFRLGVDVRLSTYVDADDVAAERPDVVIVAAGSHPRLDGVQMSHPGAPILGMQHRSVASSHDVMGGDLPEPGSRAVVIDDVGHYEAVAVAETLLAQGVDVDFVTRHISFAPLLENTFQNRAHLRRLTRAGNFSVHARTRVVEISDEGVATVPAFQEPGDNGGAILPASKVVVITANAANRELAAELAAAGLTAKLCGDALSPRFLGAAIRDGRSLAVAV